MVEGSADCYYENVHAWHEALPVVGTRAIIDDPATHMTIGVNMSSWSSTGVMLPPVPAAVLNTGEKAAAAVQPSCSHLFM